VSELGTARATAPTHPTSHDAIVTRDKVVTMPRMIHTTSGLQDALRSSGKGSWKFTLVPLGFAALILIAMLVVALSSH
jgi:hypothetical protein